jgi:hypothetical protein
MPSADQIVSGLAAMAIEWRSLAIAWHAVFGLLILFLATGGRPPQRAAAGVLVLAVMSVSVVAWTAGNWFNAVVFSGLALALGTLAYRMPADPIEMAPRSRLALGAVLLGFGLVYPHFVRSDTLFAYLYASPLGLVPCPTLAAAIGLTVMVAGNGWGRWSAVLSGAGIVYGLVGVLVLDVWIDVCLLLGAIVLAVIVAWHRAGTGVTRRDQLEMQ